MKKLKLLLPYIRKYRHNLIIGFIFVTISNIASAYSPRIIGQTVDLISSGEFEMSEVYLKIGTILGLVLISGIFMMFTRRQIIVASRKIEYDLRDDLFNSFQIQSTGFFNRNSTGSLMAHANNDIPAARDFLGPAIMYSANTITMFIFALFFMISLDPMITIFGLIPLPIIAVATYFIGKKIHVAFKNVQDQFGEVTTQAQESISGVKVVRSYNREKYEFGLFSNLSRDYLKKYLKLARYEALFMPLLMVLVGLSQIAVLGYGGYKVIENSATLGDLTQFFIYLNLLIWPVAAIGWITNIIQRAAASCGRLQKLMNEVPDVLDNENTDKSISEISGSIKFTDVVLSYPDSKGNALDKVSFELKQGQTLGIVGSVGSGKSSIVNLVPRLFNISSGKIEIDGIEIEKYPIKLLRKSIGVVTQEPFLFSASIKENLLFGKPNATDEELIEASEKASLHQEILTFNDGYNTMLGERGVTLSGGQKQRLAIARAILKNPNILILDDALSAVDAGTEQKILQELKSIMKGRTTIIISHRISTVQNANNIIVLENGSVIESGSHESLIKMQGKYYESYSRQQLEQELETL